MKPTDIYSRPPPNLIYSNKYFTRLTFSDVATIHYPTIAPPGSFASWTVDASEPTDPHTISIEDDEVIPSVEDLQAILTQLTYGKTSVNVQYHFVKIRLCVLVNNNAPAVASAHAVYERLSGLLAPRHAIKLGECPIRSPFQGLTITEFPLFKLGCLVGEEWLEEDIVNALCEFSYFKSHPFITNSSCPPHIILPTLFANEAATLFSSTVSTFNKDSLPFKSTMIGLQRRLKAYPFSNIHLITCDNKHYSVQTYCPATGILQHCDSLGRSPPPFALPMFRALLSGNPDVPLPEHIAQVPVPMQSRASGSCGIAAFNFLQAQLAPDTLPWTDSSSEHHRMVALRDLALFHLVSLCRDIMGPETLPICAVADDEIDPTLPVGYNDFNLTHPTTHHSIHYFLEELKMEPFQEVTLYDKDYNREDSPLTPLSASPEPPMVQEVLGLTSVVIRPH
ncbi:hypothetical protein CC2G_002361 [Coprinopsis cinerea AmutBmut pab1-1]|nr:hypothetical protein CC2G_002361 [Coprinopsis cinerea AmutBmut pab1-1]